MPPRTASIVWDLDYQWNDSEWMRTRHERNKFDAPMSIYEVHLGSWMRVPEEGNRSLSYRELAVKLADYVNDMGFTHVELMPVMEHPFFGSWGYQITGYYAPSARFGTPQDFMYLVDYLHQHDIGVILDWVPSHFPNDEHGLAYFDGTHLVRTRRSAQGLSSRLEVVDLQLRPQRGARLPASATPSSGSTAITSTGCAWMPSPPCSIWTTRARQGEWIPNQFGGRENLGAVSFLKDVNQEAYEAFPDIQTIAEESTAWPMVSRPTYIGGLGFGMKWDMGWMHDTLLYMSKNPIHRKYHHNKLTFRGLYAFTENFVLPLSHDEVVHGKGSLYRQNGGRRVAEVRQSAAAVRLHVHPAGQEAAIHGRRDRPMERVEPRRQRRLARRWDSPPHQGVQRWVRDLNTVLPQRARAV